jgi:hypothetical protein
MQSQTAVVDLFRRAVSGGAFAEAEQLLGQYRQEVVASWHAAAGASERHAIAADVAALLEWARVTTLSARTHAQGKLVLLDRQSVYAHGVRKDQRFSLDA